MSSRYFIVASRSVTLVLICALAAILAPDRASADSLPLAVDNSMTTAFPPIGNQGTLQASTSFAVGYYAATYMNAKDEGLDASTGDSNVVCSPSFLHNTSYRGAPSDYFNFPIYKFAASGCCSLAKMPYTADNVTTWPSTDAWVEAMNRGISGYQWVGDNYNCVLTENDVLTLKRHLANGNIAVTHTWIPAKMAEFYPNNAPGINNGVVFSDDIYWYNGEHSFAIVGYDDNKEYHDGTTTRTGALLLASSYGPDWGVTNSGGIKKGFCWVSYDFFRHADHYFGFYVKFTDRPHYRPRLYALANMYSPSRDGTLYYAGIGSRWDPIYGGSEAIAWEAPIQIDARGGPQPINNESIPVDLTAGIPYIADPSAVKLFAYFTYGQLNSVTFFHDFDGNGTFQSVAATGMPKPCPNGYFVCANVQFSADSASITPSSVLDVAGPAGGPFAPVAREYALTNGNDFPVSCTISKSANWLDLSTTFAELGVGDSTTVTATINASAESLAPGTYNDTINVHNHAVGLDFRRSVRLTVRPAVALALSPVSSPQRVGTSFPLTIRAVDSLGQTVPQISGTATLSTEASTSFGSGTGTFDYLLFSYYHDSRAQMILHPDEVGKAGTILSLSLNITRVPAQVLNYFTIRMKHTTLPDFNSTALWEDSGWSTVYQNNQNITSTGWQTFTFATPFSYNGVDNLMIDVCFNNTYYTSPSGQVASTGMSTNRTMYGYTDSGYGDPLTWAGSQPYISTNTSLPNMRFGFAPGGNISPTVTGTFVNGVWSGDVSFDNICEAICILAQHTSGIVGQSNRFNVDDVVNVEPRDQLNASGPAGGPFAPPSRDYGITNSSSEAVTVAVAASAPWIALSATSVVVAPGETTTITATIGTDANSLSPAVYNETITLQNLLNGLVIERGLNLVVRPAVALQWSAVTSPQVGGQPFAGTIRAVDGTGATVRQIGSTATLALELESNTGVGDEFTAAPFGNWSSWTYPSVRYEVLYLASDVHSSGTMSSIALRVDELPGTVLNNFTVRVKPTSSVELGPQWEAGGWTVVYQSNLNLTALGWNTLEFSTPYFYNGTDNLIFDFSFTEAIGNNDAYGLGSYVGAPRMMEGVGYGDPLLWTGSTYVDCHWYRVPDLRIGFSRNILLSPSLVDFTDGTWSGDLLITGASPQVCVRADHSSGISGRTNLFAVIDDTTITQIASTGNDILSFDFGLDRGVTVTLTNAIPGGYLSIRRVAPLSNPPAWFRYPRNLIDEYLVIEAIGLGPDYTADVEWAYDTVSDDRLGGFPVDSVWRFDGDTSPTAQFTPDVAGNKLTLHGITGFSSWYAGNHRAGDNVNPSVASVEVQSGSAVDVTFSEAIAAGATNAASYTISGSGKGTLGAHPASVALVSGNTYRLSWTSGEMVLGGDITITVSGVQDDAGNGTGTPNSGTHAGGGIGIPPTVVSISRAGASPTGARSVSFTVVFTEPVSGVVAPNFSLALSGVTGMVGSVSGSGTTWTAQVTSLSGTGTVGLNLTNASSITDAAGNLLGGVPVTGEVYTVSRSVVYVSPSGNDATGDGSIGNPLLTIGNAITQASEEATVFVGEGTYSERVAIDKDLLLVGDPGTGKPGAGAGAPIIDGGGSETVLEIGSTNPAVLVGVAGVLIRNGNAGDGIRNRANLALSNTSITQCAIALRAEGNATTVTTSQLLGNAIGIRYDAGELSATLNRIELNTTGVLVSEAAGDISGRNVRLNRNHIEQNTFGVENASGAGDLDARNNWWGSVKGPLPAGQGNAVSSRVLYDPYYGKGQILKDTDGDGLADADEDVDLDGARDDNETIFSVAEGKDSDGDHYEDGVEARYGTDPLNLSSHPVEAWLADTSTLDSDIDRYKDFYEYEMGTDPNNSASMPTLGDVDGNGSVNNLDVIAVLNQALLKGTVDRLDDADANRDGVINNLDVLALLNVALNKITLP